MRRTVLMIKVFRHLLFLVRKMKLSPVMLDGLSIDLIAKTTKICNFVCACTHHFSLKELQIQINTLAQHVVFENHS